MKVLIEQNADGAKEILISNPQLAQALLLIQMEFNLVKKQDVQALTQNVSNQITMQNDENEEKHSNHNHNSKNNDNDDDEGNENDISMQTTNKVSEEKLQKLSNQQQNVLGQVLKMSKEEIEKLPEAVQAKIRAVQAQLAKQQDGKDS